MPDRHRAGLAGHAGDLGGGPATVERLRKRFVEEGLERELSAYQMGGRIYAKVLDGEGEARLVALACSAPPDGRGRWTLRLPASRMVDLAHVPQLSHETVRQELKKNALKSHLRRMWCIPPQQSAEFAFHMEDVFEGYGRPYDPNRPVVCVDETFKKLIGETREPLAAWRGAVERFDHVDTRNGAASLFLAFEPLADWRQAAVTDHHRCVEWAGFVRGPLDGLYRDAEPMWCWSWTSSTPMRLSSLYEAFPPEKARRA